MSISLENLRCFDEAARLLSFRAAARRVSLSPAAFGQRIRQLEDDLGSPLFARTTRSVVLTEAGIRFVPYVQRALSAVADCEQVGRANTAPLPLELTLGTRHELGLSWVVPLVDTLESSHPGLTLNLYFGSGNDLVTSVRSLSIDCAVTSTRITDPKLDAVRLHEEDYVFVGATRLLREQPLRNARDAKNHTLLDTTAELPLFRYWRDAPGGIDSLAFGRVIRLGTIAAILQQVLRGRGVAVLPSYFVAHEIRRGKLQRVMPKIAPLSDYFRLVFRADDPRRSVMMKLAETMRKVPLK